MKSKISFFSRTLFLNTIKRFWPIFVAYLLIWLIALPLTLNSSLKWATLYGGEDLNFSAAQHILSMGTYGAPIIAAMSGLFFAMAAFSYLYNPGSVSMVSSLPIKRESVFLSVFSTGIAGMFVSNIVVFLVTLAVQYAYGVTGVLFLIQWLTMTCLNCLFFYGFAVFCACLTGHILVLPFLYAVLNFVFIAVEFFSRAALDAVCYGLDNNLNFVLGVFSPLYKLIFKSRIEENIIDGAEVGNLLNGLHYNGWTTLVIYGIFGIVFATLALLLVKRRRMETAGDVVAVKPLKPIFKYCMSLGSALIIGVAVTALILPHRDSFGKSGVITLLVCMLFGAFIGWFASEMLLQKTLRVFSGKAWMGYIITALVIVVLICAFEFDAFGFERKTPEADDVKSVTISGGYGTFEETTLVEVENIESVIELHKSIIANKYEYEQPIYNDSPSFYETNLYIKYELNNGKYLNRYYTIDNNVSDDYEVLNEIINSDEAVLERKKTYIPVTTETFSYGTIDYYDISSEEYRSYGLSAEEAVELYSNCVVPDIEAGSLGNIWLDSRSSLVNGSSYSESVYDCTIIIELAAREAAEEYAYDSFRTTVTKNAQRTLDWLSSHGIVPSLMKDISPEYYSKHVYENSIKY